MSLISQFRSESPDVRKKKKSKKSSKDKLKHKSKSEDMHKKYNHSSSSSSSAPSSSSADDKSSSRSSSAAISDSDELSGQSYQRKRKHSTKHEKNRKGHRKRSSSSESIEYSKDTRSRKDIYEAVKKGKQKWKSAHASSFSVSSSEDDSSPKQYYRLEPVLLKSKSKHKKRKQFIEIPSKRQSNLALHDLKKLERKKEKKRKRPRHSSSSSSTDDAVNYQRHGESKKRKHSQSPTTKSKHYSEWMDLDQDVHRKHHGASKTAKKPDKDYSSYEKQRIERSRSGSSRDRLQYRRKDRNKAAALEDLESIYGDDSTAKRKEKSEKGTDKKYLDDVSENRRAKKKSHAYGSNSAVKRNGLYKLQASKSPSPGEPSLSVRGKWSPSPYKNKKYIPKSPSHSPPPKTYSSKSSKLHHESSKPIRKIPKKASRSRSRSHSHVREDKTSREKFISHNKDYDKSNVISSKKSYHQTNDNPKRRCTSSSSRSRSPIKSSKIRSPQHKKKYIRSRKSPDPNERHVPTTSSAEIDKRHSSTWLNKSVESNTVSHYLEQQESRSKNQKTSEGTGSPSLGKTNLIAKQSPINEKQEKHNKSRSKDRSPVYEKKFTKSSIREVSNSRSRSPVQREDNIHNSKSPSRSRKNSCGSKTETIRNISPLNSIKTSSLEKRDMNTVCKKNYQSELKGHNLEMESPSLESKSKPDATSKKSLSKSPVYKHSTPPKDCKSISKSPNRGDVSKDFHKWGKTGGRSFSRSPNSKDCSKTRKDSRSHSRSRSNSIAHSHSPSHSERSRKSRSGSYSKERSKSYSKSRSKSYSKSRSKSYSKSRSKSYSRSRSTSFSADSRSRSRSYSSRSRSRSAARSPSIPRRRGSPSFLDKRRITSARKRPVPYRRPSPPTPSSTSSWSYRSLSRSSSPMRVPSRSPVSRCSSSRSRSRSQSWSPVSYQKYEIAINNMVR